MHSVPFKCFKSVTIKHVTATRASSETHFNRTAWMEQRVPLYTQFDLLPRDEKGGPTYLSCVWKKCDKFANETVVMQNDKNPGFCRFTVGAWGAIFALYGFSRLCGAARKVTSATLFVSVKFLNADSQSTFEF